MNRFPAPGLPAPSSVFGVLRSWLRGESGQSEHSLEVPLGDFGSEPRGETRSEGRRPKPHSFGAVRVLVADDNPVNLLLISALLESRGLEPWLAADGAEAVALACELPFDLILMDIQMPILNGLAATAAIRRFETHGNGPAMPVIAYSSLPPGADVLAKHGLNGSLAKPCEDAELEACLVRWCPTYRAVPAQRAGAPSADNGGWYLAARSP